MTAVIRWRERKSIFRRPDEQIKTAEFDVAEILRDTDARPFIEQHHYSASYPAARFRFGLYRHGELAGVAVFSHPANDLVLTNVFPALPIKQTVELGRFVLLDEVAGNGETWFLARAFELLAGRIRGVVSFSDPIPRTAISGRVVFPGHVGTIYQASNARFLGRGAKSVLRVLPDGRVLAPRSLTKVRSMDRGWTTVVKLLEQFGADPIDMNDPSAWLDDWLPHVTRPLRHPGNLKYAFGLDRRVRHALPVSLPYPKRVAA